MKLLKTIALSSIVALAAPSILAMEPPNTGVPAIEASKTLDKSYIQIAVRELEQLANHIERTLESTQNYYKTNNPQDLKLTIGTVRSLFDEWSFGRIQSIIECLSDPTVYTTAVTVLQGDFDVCVQELTALNTSFLQAYEREDYKAQDSGALKKCIENLRSTVDDWHSARIQSIANPFVVALQNSTQQNN